MNERIYEWIKESTLYSDNQKTVEQEDDKKVILK